MVYSLDGQHCYVDRDYLEMRVLWFASIARI